MLHVRLLVLLFAGLVIALPLRADETKTIKHVLASTESKLPEAFRLKAESFDCHLAEAEDLSPLYRKQDVRFPSPMVTEVVENNTVHGEIYVPKSGGRKPAVIVLHILGGDFPLARSFCHVLASKGVVALFIKMPYYGERRPKDSPKRMLSHEPKETVTGFTQAVLDIRRGVDLLASREDVDPARLGVFGISLGGITGGLVAGLEPRLQHVCLLLAGGDLGRVVWESRETERARAEWVAKGKTKEDFLEILKPVDPLTYAENLRGRRVLFLNAKEDEVIPPECTKSLWRAAGEPDIVWYSGGHYTVARHLLDAMKRTGDFFTTKPSP